MAASAEEAPKAEVEAEDEHFSYDLNVFPKRYGFLVRIGDDVGNVSARNGIKDSSEGEMDFFSLGAHFRDS